MRDIDFKLRCVELSALKCSGNNVFKRAAGRKKLCQIGGKS
jgi:hypothetical protein